MATTKLDLKAENARLLAVINDLHAMINNLNAEICFSKVSTGQANRDLVQANKDLKAEIEGRLEWTITRASNAMHIMRDELESLRTRISTLSW